MKWSDKRVGKRWCAVAVALLALSACVNEEPVKSDVVGGEDALVNLSFVAAAPEEVVTRTMEEEIRSLHVLVFNAAGSLQTLKYIADYPGATAEEKRIATRSGSNCTVYAVANMRVENTGSVGDGSFFDGILTLTQFENKFATISGADVERQAGMLMCGKLAGVTISPLPTVTNLTQELLLHRLSSKITLNVKDGTPSGHTVIAVSYEIYNLPLYSWFASKATDYYADNASFGAAAFYQKSAGFFSDVAAEDGIITKQGVFYMLENRRGGRAAIGGSIGTGTDQRQKAKYAPAYATYALIKARYINSTDGEENAVKYKVYLGANNSNDYNIERNKHYIYNVTITGANETDVTVDSRVNAREAFRFNLWNQKLDAHYDSQAFNVQTLTGHIRIELLNMDNTSVDASTSWLKFSRLATYPNHADVASDPANALVTSEETDCTGTDPDVQDTYWRYLYADENLSGADRELKLRVTYNNGDLVIDKTITQKAMQPVGLFGGTLGSSGYTKQLGVEQFEEYKIPYKDGTTASVPSGMQWGFRGVTTGVIDKVNGLAGTMTLARLTSPANGGLTGTYHPLYNTYAARYCYEKNRDTNGNGTLDDNEVVWYLPAQNQLMGLWVAHFGVVASFGAGSYWSATETTSNYSWNVYFGDGGTYYNYKSDNYRLRCVRELTSVGTLSAQQVVVNSRYSSIEADVIIDSRSMPAGSITATAKPMSTDGTATTLGTNTVGNLGSILNNEKVFHYFAVSKVDNSVSTSWLNAFMVCRAYNSGDGAGKWRLPTQRELQLMWILASPLTSAGVASFSAYNYWNAMENTSNLSWNVTFNTGYTSDYGFKHDNYWLRCVRDVTP